MNCSVTFDLQATFDSGGKVRRDSSKASSDQDVRGDIRRVELQLVQIVERIGAAQLASVDQAHVHVADAGAVAGLVEHRILAMQNRFL